MLRRIVLLALLGILLIECTTTAAANEEHPGWKTWLKDNIREYENVTIAWDDPSKVPSWLYGTYLKNGPARSEFGGEKSYANLIDGWAKISKFHVSPKGVTFSSKFLKTPLYQKCEAANEIIPQSTVGPIRPEGWGLRDFLTILKNVADNTDITIEQMGSDFIASTDLPSVNIFNVSTLEWQEFYTPSFTSWASTAHWRKELGTDNMLNYHITSYRLLSHELKLFRYPHGNLRNPQLIGKFKLEHSTLIHMFSVTPNYAIFFVYPIHIQIAGCVIYPQLLQNMFECIRWDGESKPTNVIVMSLMTGKVVSSTNVKGLYSTHHINAYETTAAPNDRFAFPVMEEQRCQDDEPKIVVDIVIAPWDALKNYTDKQVLLNSVDTGKDYNAFNITRFTINLHSNTISSVDWHDIAPGLKQYYNQFDFPSINPNHEGKHYCYAYGQALVENYRQYLIKKSTCDSTQDRVWYKKNHYTAEPMFIPRPGATEEDDGVLLVIVLDGETEKSYLLLLDGKRFETLTVAKLNDYIPISIHGKWIDGQLL